jgi:pyridoxamine 5'-phosphate oxidase
MSNSDSNTLFYNDLTLSLMEAKSLIEAGSSDRRRPAHTPVVATVDNQGAASQRVMILRHVDWSNRTLRFHTDSRATKTGEADDAPISVLFYDPDAKVQIRLSGSGRIERTSALANAAWDNSTLFARRCYMAEIAPGTSHEKPVSGLPTWIEGQQPTAEQIEPARDNFAVLLFQFDRLEWLYLANSGHRRAQWRWDESEQIWQGSWLVP